MLASRSCLLTDVADQLHELSKKINIVDRLSRHLDKRTLALAAASYLQQVKKMVPAEPVVYMDDSDVVKPVGYKFEALGIVRDGSESTATKNVYKKGYRVTEACVLTTSNHPVSIFSNIHSSQEKDYKSANTITFHAIEQGAALFGKATFAMDRGYDDNKIFLKPDELGQNYVILQFEKFRVRRLKTINALNFYITLYMAFLARVSMGSETNTLKVSILKTANPIKKKVFFCYYRLAKGISGILSYAKEGADSGSGQSVLHTVNSALSWLFE